MKSGHFIKFNSIINRSIGSKNASLIINTLEYWFKKKPDGFYKFINPCSHNLYVAMESWTEVLGCDRKTFISSFDKIGIRYISRTSFNESEDKFQGKMYASYYDRYSNRTFFVRNHSVVESFLSSLQEFGNGKNSRYVMGKNNSGNGNFSHYVMTKTGQSYKEPKSTSKNLLIDVNMVLNCARDEKQPQKNHKKMLDIWNEVLSQKTYLTVKITGKLLDAFEDQFNQSLDKWSDYCKLLENEDNPMIDWYLRSDIIDKILLENEK